jgi:ribosome-associated protein
MTRFGYDIATEGKEVETFGPSKTQVKDDMLELRDLGQELLEIPQERFARIPMDERLREAFAELQRISSHGAKKRQAQYIGKLLRDTDAEGFKKVLENYRRGKAAAAQGFPEIAQWRDRLLAEDSALTDWLNRYPLGDTRQLRSVIRAARKEEAASAEALAHSGLAPPKGRAYRALFQVLRSTSDAAELDG